MSTVIFAVFLGSSSTVAAGQEPKRIKLVPTMTVEQRSIIDTAGELLETANVSYAMGGAKVGSPESCDACNTCLATHAPKPKSRFAKCPICVTCSLDCSHFTQIVFARAGFPYPYLPTAEMLDLQGADLKDKYKLIDIPFTAGALINVGDLLVYRGHVVIVERVREGGRGDIVHATGGRDIKEPGQGIQRERHIRFSDFRGPLLRVLRHADLQLTQSPPQRR